MKAKIYGLTAALVGGALLAGCASNPVATSQQTTAEPSDHGAVEGAQEMPEAPLHLVTIDESGKTGMLDLLSDEEIDLPQLPDVVNLETDGRYLFADTGSGVEVLDSGMWSWNHTDHFHYYRGTPQQVGLVSGEGPARTIGGPLSTAGSTGVYFPETGKGILLDNAELAEGRISERFTTQAAAHQGLIAPLGDGAVQSEPASASQPAQVQYLDAQGHRVEGAHSECGNPADATHTAAGLAIACDQGIVVASEKQAGGVEFSLLKYPKGTSADQRIKELSHRKSRPVVAAAAGERGAWVINTRNLTMTKVMSDQELRKVSAVGDAKGHVVALDAQGRVLVYSTESGKVIGTTEPLLKKSLQDAQALDSVNLVLDAQRAYVNAPAEKRVYEIDFADSARIARTLSPGTDPIWMTQVGN
ncbi:ABC transporter [Glutamicibacter sp. JL.03c]|uniref:ABC transporter n=1 Tax=Glutamicibacter sp. JL.03c TaxID=2984842 RepID=UPI0021F6F2BB|nr:ABC transporter [Glutamicibacter sp. JL.03c]UYQ77015.1 ABC transporter [Glutamicibacter sp. JL.03c]